MAPPYDQNLITDLSPTTFADVGSTITTSSYGVLMPRFTGFASVIGSVLIIYLILRSPTRLSSSYHRIMFGMSIFDVFTSTAMGLTTLPMPRDDPVVNSYGFNGTRLGNFGTCTAQGFFWVLGLNGANSYNMILFVYYFFSIGLLLQKRLIDKCIEPLLHILALSVSITFAVLPLVVENYNPSIRNPWCTNNPFKAYIDTEEGKKVIILRGDNDMKWKDLVAISVIVFLSVGISCLFFTTILVCIRDWKQKHHRQSDEEQQQNRQEGIPAAAAANATNTHNTDGDHTDSETKIILIHSLCYFLAMLITDIFPKIRVLRRNLGEGGMQTDIEWIEKCFYFFLPLQGFFNFLIFVGSKIASFKMIQPNLTVVEALNQMFCNPKPDPYVMTSLDIVDNDRQNEAEHSRRIELLEALQRREQGDNSSTHSIDESSNTPSRANTNDENVEFTIRSNIDRLGIRRVGEFTLNTAGVNNSSLIPVDAAYKEFVTYLPVDAADPRTARNVCDQGLNEAGLVKEDELLIINDNDDIESIHNNTTSNQNTGINDCTGSNNVAATSNYSSSRIDNRNHMAHRVMIAYPKSSQDSCGNSNSLGGFTNMAEEC